MTTETDTIDTNDIPTTKSDDRNIRLANRPFLLVKISQRPAIIRPLDPETGRKLTSIEMIEAGLGKPTPTHKKGWRNVRDAVSTFEQTSILDRIKPHHLRDYAVIIDILRGTLIKHNFRHVDPAYVYDNDQIVEHYLSKYMDVCKQGVSLYLTKMAKDHLAANGLEDTVSGSNLFETVEEIA